MNPVDGSMPKRKRGRPPKSRSPPSSPATAPVAAAATPRQLSTEQSARLLRTPRNSSSSPRRALLATPSSGRSAAMAGSMAVALSLHGSSLKAKPSPKTIMSTPHHLMSSPAIRRPDIDPTWIFAGHDTKTSPSTFSTIIHSSPMYPGYYSSPAPSSFSPNERVPPKRRRTADILGTVSSSSASSVSSQSSHPRQRRNIVLNISSSGHAVLVEAPHPDSPEVSREYFYSHRAKDDHFGNSVASLESLFPELSPAPPLTSDTDSSERFFSLLENSDGESDVEEYSLPDPALDALSAFKRAIEKRRDNIALSNSPEEL